MYDLNKDTDLEIKKRRERLKKIQEEIEVLEEQKKVEKEYEGLARKVGMLIVTKFKGESFEYDEFKKLLDDTFVIDSERQFFNLEPLAENDERRPKKRGGRPKGSVNKAKSEEQITD